MSDHLEGIFLGDTVQPYMYVDLNPFLPDTWVQELERFAQTNLFQVKQSEGGPGSIGYQEAGGIDYQTAMMPEISAELRPPGSRSNPVHPRSA